MKYLIRFGLSGGFGGANEAKVIDCDTQEQADMEAYYEACDYYDKYDGLHGLRSIEDIMNEDDMDEESATEQWKEEREEWLEYWSEPYDEEKHKYLLI